MTRLIHDLTAADTAAPALAAAFGPGLGLFSRSSASIDLAQLPFAIDLVSPLPGPVSSREKSYGGWSGLRHLTWSRDPFAHALADRPLIPLLADALLEWLEGIAAWSLNDGGFFRSWELALDRLTPPQQCRAMFQPGGLADLEQSATALFGQPLHLHGPIIAHRMEPGQGVGVHSDKPMPGEETHRIIVQLSRPTRLADGGHFVLLAGENPRLARRILPRAHNTAIAFRLGEDSPHAITTVRAGMRYSVVLSFS